MFDIARVQDVGHGGIVEFVGRNCTELQSILGHNLDEGGQKFVHSLAVTTDMRVQFAVEKEDVEDHGLNGILVVEGRIRQPPDILEDFGADGFVLSDGLPRGIRDVGQGVKGQRREELGMADELQVLSTKRIVYPTRFAQDKRPLRQRGIAEEKESLPAHRATSGDTRTRWAVELDGSLKIGDGGAVSQRLIPSRPGSMLVRVTQRRRWNTHFCSPKDLMVVMACSELDVSTSEREKRDDKEQRQRRTGSVLGARPWGRGVLLYGRH